MPQIEEVQFVWWGPFRPDTVPLAVDGINVATGPNGAGKTAFLDGMKLLLGTEQLKAKPVDYIYVSGSDDEDEPTNRAQRALLRALFANPERSGGQGRLFADAGRGCERAEYVTAICEVTRDRRRYVLVPGRIVWGGKERDLEDDLERLSKIPARHWLGPRQWQGLMARAGITRSLVQLMSMPQGETDQAINGTPEELLRRALELTGRQEILDDFRDAKKALAEARSDHREASERFSGEQQRLEVLAGRMQRHEEYVEARARVARIEDLELPVALHRATAARLDTVAGEREGTASSVEALRASVAQLRGEIPRLEEVLGSHDRATADLRKRADAARKGLQDASERQGALKRDHEQLTAAATAAAREHGGQLDEELVAAAEREADVAAAAAQRLREEITGTEREVDELAAGRPVLPPGLQQFRALLAERGVTADLVAERLDADDPALAQAALHEGVWALIVDPAHFEEAVALAVEHGHRLPIARAGEGTPAGALAGAAGLPEAGAYLAELSPPVDEVPGVSSKGLVRGREWAAWRRPERPVLGEEARRAALTVAQERLAEQRDALRGLDAAREATRRRAGVLRDGLRASERMTVLDTELAEASTQQEKATVAMTALEVKLAEHGETRGRLDTELRKLRERRAADETQLIQSERRLKTYDRQVAELEAALIPLTPEQEALDEVASEDALKLEAERLRQQLDDEIRYPAEVRSEMVLVEHEDQERRVAEIDELLDGRERNLEEVSVEVERARQRYAEHIRQVIGIVSGRFRGLCKQAGMEGSLQLVPSGDIEGEMGLEMRVAHVRGERLLSARHSQHSGGQRVKMAILLLLASMGVEGATDLLIMDEHSAHLDSRNIDHVAELMNSLKSQVQFILAMPSHGEALRLSWCDHQLSFYERSSSELYAPPVRLLTRLPDEGEAKYTERMGQLPVAL